MAGHSSEPAAGEAEAAIICPECGKQIKHANALRKTRRRWGMALLVVPLLVGWHLADSKEQIRRQGWIVVVPTPVLAATVKPVDWFQLTHRDRQGRNPKTRAEHLHRRLMQHDWMMGIWLWRVGPLLEREGITVVSARDAAPVRVLRPQIQNLPKWPGFRPGQMVVDDQSSASFASLIISSIDSNCWIDNGGEWHGQIRRAGDSLLLRAAPNVINAVEELVCFLHEAIEYPERDHEARIHGQTYYAISMDHFTETDWFAVKRQEFQAIPDSFYQQFFVGGGRGIGGGPWLLQWLLYGDGYAEYLARQDCRRLIHEALMYETDTKLWIDFGGEHVTGRWVGDILVVHSIFLGRKYFDPAIERIRELGPEAVLAEHGVTPD